MNGQTKSSRAIKNSIEKPVISTGTSLSNSIDLEDCPLIALELPAGYDGGNISIQASSVENGTYVDVYDSTGVQINITVASGGRIVALTGSTLQAVSSLRFIKLKTTTSVSADRTIGIITKG